ncbi:MAG: hypothetical protein K2G63_01205 [Oscillospiraceae bacterium]|nr:hypothetical protein [Oscillospiraceae bacterium]
MVKIEDSCVDCGLPCLGKNCPYAEEAHYYCDKCGKEDILYEVGHQQLCAECILDLFCTVEGSDI